MIDNIWAQFKQKITLGNIFFSLIACLSLWSAYSLFSGPPHDVFYKDFFENPMSYESGGISYGGGGREKITDINVNDNVIISKCISGITRRSINQGKEPDYEPHKPYAIYYNANSEKFSYEFKIELYPRRKIGWLAGVEKRKANTAGSSWENTRSSGTLQAECLYDFFYSRHNIKPAKH